MHNPSTTDRVSLVRPCPPPSVRTPSPIIGLGSNPSHAGLDKDAGAPFAQPGRRRRRAALPVDAIFLDRGGKRRCTAPSISWKG